MLTDFAAALATPMHNWPTCNPTGNPDGPCPDVSYYSNNRINQIGSMTAGYDTAGDLTSDGNGVGSYTYQYDGEGRLRSVDNGSTATEVYNALGQQVQSVTPSYTYNVLFDASGQWAGRVSAGGHWDVGGVFHFGNRLFGMYLDQFYGIHVNSLGSEAANTNAAGTEVGGTLFYLWGQTWMSGAPAWNFAAFEYGDDPNLFPTLNRTYQPGYGRWMTPDPMGGDITNPQSFNHYAYAPNNPANSIDPSGLRGKPSDNVCDGADPLYGPCNGGISFTWSFYDSGHYGQWEECVLDGFDTPCPEVRALEDSGAADECTLGICTGVGRNGTKAAFFRFISTLEGSGYEELSDPISDSSSKLNQIYEAYLLACRYAANACSSVDAVSVRYVGSTYNVQLKNSPLAGAIAGSYKDPSFFNNLFHPGAANSYYVGGDYVGIDAGHVVDLPGGVEAHYDSFAPFNPLHWIFEALPSWFINTRAQAGGGVSYTCTMGAGCY